MSELTPNQRKWLDALRSGDYVQGPGNLRTKDNRMCCLGIACELAVADGVKVEVTAPGTSTPWRPTDRWQYDDLGGMPPVSVKAWLGITDAAADNLAARNDGGATFAEIADWVERDPEVLTFVEAEEADDC